MPDPSIFTGYTDFALTKDGDIALDKGDIQTATGLDWLTQTIIFVLRTEPGDYLVDTYIGGSLEKFIGEQNTRELASKIRETVLRSLNYEPWAHPGKLECRVVPMTSDSLSLYITLDLPNETRTYLAVAEFDYSTGGIVMKDLKLKDTVAESGTREVGVTGYTHEVTENKYLKRIRDNNKGE
jgi:phage baseplate assembly protein W